MMAAYSFHMLAFGVCNANAILEEHSSMLQSQRIDSVASNFDEFVQVHGRNYGPDEYEHRRSLFANQVEHVSELNGRPGRLWTAGINHLSDWTAEEIQGLLGWRGHARSEAGYDASLLQSVAQRTDSESHLWDAELVGEAANQGPCGSCWAVATAKMLEANYRIHTGLHNRTFSAQQILDCTPNPMLCGGDGGCGGATVELAMAQTSEFGVATSEEMPYVADAHKCARGQVAILKDGDEEKGLTMKKLNTPDREWTTGGAFKELRLQQWRRLSLNSGEALKTALLKGTVAVSADGSFWPPYSHGIFNGCSPDATINHAIVAVGFGSEKSGKFWKILNSWGPNWGEGGYIRLHRSDDEYCGTDYQPEEGTACTGEGTAHVATVKVCGMCGLFYDNVFAQFA